MYNDFAVDLLKNSKPNYGNDNAITVQFPKKWFAGYTIERSRQDPALA